MNNKDGLFKEAFGNEQIPPPPEEITLSEDVIEISPDKESFSQPSPIKPVAPPMSKFKQQRLKEKEKKEKRKLKNNPQLMNKKLHPGETIRKISLDSNHWDTARILARDIRNTIASYTDIAIRAIGMLQIPEVEITGESREILESRCNIVFRDVESLTASLDHFQTTINRYTGPVRQDDLPFFLSLYEDMLILNQDVINVLTEPCNILTDLMGVVHELYTAEQQKAKETQPLDNDPSIEVKGEENV